jgi:hypothetical protein
LWVREATAIRSAQREQRLLVMSLPYRRMMSARLANAIWHATRTAAQWVEFKDFGFYRLQPLDIYYVGRLGVMGWVTTEEYQSAKIDPLAEAAPKIVGHMNSDHVPAMILLARVHAGLEATEATMTGGRPAWISPSAEDRRWHERDAHQLSTRSPKLGRGTQSARVNDPVAEPKA